MYEVVTLILRFKCGREWEDNVSDLAQARWARIIKNQKFCPEPPSKILILRIPVSRSQLQTATTTRTTTILFVVGMFLERRCLCFLCPTMAKEMHMRSSPIIFSMMLLDDMGWASATGQHHAGSSLCHLTLAQWTWRCAYWEVPDGMNMGEDRNDMMG